MNQKLLIWCRRFRPEYGEKFRFHGALAQACSGLAYPVTIQDSSYSWTFLGSFFGRGWFILPATTLALIIGMFAGVMVSLMLFPDAGVGPVVMLVALFSTAILFVAYTSLRRLGYKKLSGHDSGIEVVRILDSIKAGRRGNFLGVDVIQCDDDTWRDVVAATFAKADLAVIDISEMTENLTWEISQALDALPRHRVVFVCEENELRSADLDSKLRQLLPDCEFRPDSKKDEIVVYPSVWAGVGLRRRRQLVEFANHLRLHIADRLLQEERSA